MRLDPKLTLWSDFDLNATLCLALNDSCINNTYSLKLLEMSDRARERKETQN